MLAGICTCDDRWLMNVSQNIRDYACANGVNLQILTFCERREIIKYAGNFPDVVFIDIGTDMDASLAIAEIMQKRWNCCRIIYVSDDLENVKDIYCMTPFCFILKSQFEQRLAGILSKVLYTSQKNGKRLLFSVIHGSCVILHSQEIISFEREYRNTAIITKWGKYAIWDKIDEIIERVEHLGFVRCHNSYIVALAAVHEMHANYFILCDGRKLMISRTYLQKTRDCFEKWKRMYQR